MPNPYGPSSDTDPPKKPPTPPPEKKDPNPSRTRDEVRPK